MTGPDRHEIDAYADGELDAFRAADVERAMAADPALRARYDSILALRAAIRAEAAKDAAPDLMRARVSRAIGARTEVPRRGALAASFLIGAALAGAAAWGALPRRDDAADALIAAHRRSLLAAQPFDVASSDRHTVKPWFSRKVAQSPDVVDLAADGFPLQGGRVDVIGGEPVATMVFAHGAHLVSVTALPAGAGPPRAASLAGFHLRSWTQDGLVYVAVSDIPGQELEAFAGKLRAAR